MPMEPSYNIAFARLGHFLPFLHIFAIALLMGIQAGFWMILRFFMKEFLEFKLYREILRGLKFFGYLNLTLIAVIAVTGALLGNAETIKSADPMANAILATKFALTGLILANTIYMEYKRVKSMQALRDNDIVEVHENLIIILKYFMPFSIAISIWAIYLGVSYRSF